METEPTPRDAVPTEHDHVKWFAEHYDGAANQVIDFFKSDGLDLAGRAVADIGSGDGIIDLGVFHKAQPAKLIGYDVRPTDEAALRRTAEANSVSDPYPNSDQLSFVESGIESVPAPDSSFDFAYSWSVFEHVSSPVAMFSEIRRILKPDGVFFLQIWPLFHSEHGGHLWMSRSDAFPHLRKDPHSLEDEIKFNPATDPTRPADDEFRSLNRLTIDDLQRAMLAGGLIPVKLELISETIHIPGELARHPLSALGISGVKLLATPRFK